MAHKLGARHDGVKSFAGILFQTIVFPRDIIYIDEPEAFLHPPQMRKLGKTLAEESAGQLIIATHSTDILRGFLEGDSDRIRVIRLTRNGSVNNAKELPPNRVRDLWQHPQIRHSNALDALFHEQAIICEDDSDCRLYSAIAGHLADNVPDHRRVDSHYIPTGGKHGAARIASALSALDVPIKMVFDIDLLSEAGTLKRTYESVGGESPKIVKFWGITDAAVREGVKALSPSEMKTKIIEVLEKDETSIPKNEIRDLLKQDKPWAIVKKMGNVGIPAGEATKNFQTLVELLELSGIFLVPVGEAENFCKSIGGHGPGFVTKLLEEKALSDPELESLCEFVDSFASVTS